MSTASNLSFAGEQVMAASLLNINLAIIKAGADTDAQLGIAIASLVMLAIMSAALAWPRQDPVVGGVAAWALFAIGSKLSGSTGTMRQGDIGTDAVFNTNTLTNLATASFSIAGVYALATFVLLCFASYRVFIRIHTYRDLEEEPVENDPVRPLSGKGTKSIGQSHVADVAMTQPRQPCHCV